MANTIEKVLLVTNSNSFKFNSIDEMFSFENNNYKQLGETSYSIHLSWEDGGSSIETFSGVNASANLLSSFGE